MHDTPKHTQLPKTQPSTSLKQTIQQKLTKQQHIQSNKKQKVASKFKQQGQQIPEHQLKVLQTIQQFESKVDPGYMNYQGWVSFHNQIYSYIKVETITNFWKIIRLINYGQVMIPTGLIYQIFIYFATKKKIGQPKQTNLKSVINSFLSINQKNDFINNFRQLSNYPSLDQIEKEYCLQFGTNKQQRLKKGNGELHERLFKEGRTRDHSLQKLKYASMVNELKECKFAPTINVFNPKTAQKKCSRICKHTQVKEMPQQQFNHNFVALQIDKDIYKCKVEEVPGAKEHIKRAVQSQAERRKIQRYFAKPWLKLR